MAQRDDFQTQQRLNALRNQASVDLQLQRHQQEQAEEQSENEQAQQQQMMAEQQENESEPQVDVGALQNRATQLESEGKKAKKSIGQGYAMLGLGSGAVALWFTIVGPIIGFGFWVLGGFLIGKGNLKLKQVRREAESIQAQSPSVKVDARAVSNKLKDTPRKYILFGSCSCMGVLVAGALFIVLIVGLPIVIVGGVTGAVKSITGAISTAVQSVTP